MLRQAVNDPVVQAAVEDGAKLRVDITVVETDIHRPTDNIVGRVVNPAKLSRDRIRITATTIANNAH
jgi:hypothetical protein